MGVWFCFYRHCHVVSGILCRAFYQRCPAPPPDGGKDAAVSCRAFDLWDTDDLPEHLYGSWQGEDFPLYRFVEEGDPADAAGADPAEVYGG